MVSVSEAEERSQALSHILRGTVWDQLLKAGSQQDLGTCVLASSSWYITMRPPVCALGFSPE